MLGKVTQAHSYPDIINWWLCTLAAVNIINNAINKANSKAVL